MFPLFPTRWKYMLAFISFFTSTLRIFTLNCWLVCFRDYFHAVYYFDLNKPPIYSISQISFKPFKVLQVNPIIISTRLSLLWRIDPIFQSLWSEKRPLFYLKCLLNIHLTLVVYIFTELILSDSVLDRYLRLCLNIIPFIALL